MNADSVFYQLDSEIQNDMLSKVPSDISDPNVLYETFIQYLTSRSHIHKNYDYLAYQLSIEQHHSKTCPSFVETMHKLQNNKDLNGKIKPLLDGQFYQFICDNAAEIEKVFAEVQSSSTEFLMTFFGWKTLYRAYLLQTHEGVMERLDHLWFRIALFLHTNDWERVKKSFAMLRSGEAIHATPTLYHAGMVHAQMSSCFDENTIVNTLRGPLAIKEVKIGDEVVTHNGNVKKVVQCHKNLLGNRKMYNVHISKTNNFLVTEDHKLFVFNNVDKTKDWKAVNDLTKQDYVMIPKYEGSSEQTFIDVKNVIHSFDFQGYTNTLDVKEIENGSKLCLQTIFTHDNFKNSKSSECKDKSTAIYSKIPVNEKYMKFVGIWLGDGHILCKNKTVIRGIGITIHKDNQKLIDFCKDAKDIFGIDNVAIHNMDKQNIVQVLFNCPILGILFNQLYGKGFNTKHLPENIARLATPLILSLVSGLVTTDGCVAKNGNITLCMANKTLMDQVYSICRLHNLDVGSVRKSSINKLTRHQAYQISLTNLRYDLDIWKTYKDDRMTNLVKPCTVRNQYSPIIMDGFKYLPFQSREEVKYESPYVYTLGVEDDHSYSIEGIIAQNCFLVGTEDSVKGIFKTISDAALISKYAGGIGIHISNIRAKKSYIYGTNGYSNGIMPMLRVYNDTSRYIDQCFEGQTKVVTNRGIIPICEIKPHQDSVLTKDATFHMVTKKLIHKVEKDIIKVSVDTPWDERVKYIMTSKHDMYWLNPYTKEKEFLPVEKAGYGFQPTYIQPETRDIPYYEEECFVLGYLYSSLVFYRNMMWMLSPPNDASLISRITYFLKRYFPQAFRFEPRLNNKEKMDLFLDMNLYDSAQGPSVIDFFALTPGDFPIEFALAPLGKVRKFLEGYTYTISPDQRETPKLALLKYRIGCMDKSAKILSIESKPDTKQLLYDLVVDKEHNYQTVLGLAHNGGGKRKGAFAMYLEPWHSDIYDFIMARRNTGSEEDRARDLFFGLWMPDEFMRRVETDDDWYLMSENMSPGLSNVWGKEFEDLYHSYIAAGKYTEKIKARELWFEILKSQIETGTPYILYKDTCNRCSNQQNLGTIRSSNLCCEIIEYSDNKEYAVCNLASISLVSCVKQKPTSNLDFWIFGKEGCFYCDLVKSLLVKKKIPYVYKSNKEHLNSIESQRLIGKTTYPIIYQGEACVGGFKEIWEIYLRPDFDFEKLGTIVESLVENLNIVIDKNDYPLEECKRSNFKNRPIGIGVQGLADLFMIMLEPYDSAHSRNLNRRIFETMYYYALKKSHELALVHGHYTSFQGSPLSQGKFHFEFLSVFDKEKHLSCGYNWDALRERIVNDGVRNSLLLAPMPTASTSQILGNTESFEPLTSNFYVRRTLAGEFYVMNKHLRSILESANAWKEHNIQALILDKGSIVNMDIPKTFKEVFKTVWEIPQKHLIEMAADRQMFIDQSQSFNIYLGKPDLGTLTKIHFYGWKKELKTGCYYLRTRAPISSQNFSMDPEKETSACTSCSG